MKKKLIIFYGKNVDFTDEKTGEKTKGTQLYFAMDEPVQVDGQCGYPVVKAWIADRNDIVPTLKGPGLYECEMDVKMKAGQPTLSIVEVGAFLAPLGFAKAAAGAAGS